MRKKLLSPVFLLSLSFFSCSGGGTESQPEDVFEAANNEIYGGNYITESKAFSEEEAAAAINSEQGLSSLLDSLKNGGYGEFVSSGEINDQSGTYLFYAHYSNAGGGIKTLVKACESECVYAIQEIKEGKAVWSDALGGETGVVKLGIPPLLKELKGHDWNGLSVYMLPLAGKESQAPAYELDLEGRRFIFLSPYGNTYEFQAFDKVLERAGDTGAFSNLKVDYAVKADLNNLLIYSHPYEIIVIAAPYVRELLKSEPSKIYRTFGLFLTNGGFSEILFDSPAFESALKKVEMGGPGLVFLAGGESIGDGTDGSKNIKSIVSALEAKQKTVVGFVGNLPTQVIAESTALFFEKYFGGSPLGDAVNEANKALAGKGFGAKLAANPSADMQMKFVKDPQQYWEGKQPSGGEINSFIIMRRVCKDSNGKITTEDEKQGNIWVKEIAFDGWRFSGQRDFEGSQGEQLSIKVRGILLERKEGAPIFFISEGDINSEVLDLTVYGKGKVTKVKNSGGKTEISFDGDAEATPYKNSAGDSCVLKYPKLSPLIQGEGESKVTVIY
ncbi:MAG: hypothetical protein FJ088_07755 [Deltaproteobacteria bacterium]|nr:hypothetical protein [Deltaproteobacteria bacterium]